MKDRSRRTITFDDKLYHRAQLKALKLNTYLSYYLEDLVKKDLKSRKGKE